MALIYKGNKGFSQFSQRWYDIWLTYCWSRRTNTHNKLCKRGHVWFKYFHEKLTSQSSKFNSEYDSSPGTHWMVVPLRWVFQCSTVSLSKLSSTASNMWPTTPLMSSQIFLSAVNWTKATRSDDPTGTAPFLSGLTETTEADLHTCKNYVVGPALEMLVSFGCCL